MQVFQLNARIFNCLSVPTSPDALVIYAVVFVPVIERMKSETLGDLRT